MTTEDTRLFVTDAGAEISVRAARHAPTATMTLEPLYASDLALLDGATGELRGPSGERLRGTLRRRGAVFELYPEEKQEAVQKTGNISPSASVSALRAELEEQARQPPTTQAEAIEAAHIVARFLRGERSVSLAAAKQAQSVVSRFIADRERQLTDADD